MLRNTCTHILSHLIVQSPRSSLCLPAPLNSQFLIYRLLLPLQQNLPQFLSLVGYLRPPPLYLTLPIKMFNLLMKQLSSMLL